MVEKCRIPPRFVITVPLKYSFVIIKVNLLKIFLPYVSLDFVYLYCETRSDYRYR